jgi:hypothetical protein
MPRLTMSRGTARSRADGAKTGTANTDTTAGNATE